MNVLVDYEPALIRKIVDLRTSNIGKALPSVALVTQPKSGSVTVGNIFNSGFNLPSVAYSLVYVEVIQSWAEDYARGGACYVTHLDPAPQNIDRLKRAGIGKIIVHVRDPRQILLSMIHHVSRYEENRPALLRNAFSKWNVSAQIWELMDFYMRRIRWLQGWLEAESQLNIMFSTFEDFVRDRHAFVERYVEFYGAPREHFSLERAVRVAPETDDHFRVGLVDEWRKVFPRSDTELLSACLPRAIKKRFGWTD
jgi:hypothetical protein